MSEQENKTKEEKVGVGGYIALAFACVFFSGVLASNQWWGIFDFSTLNGAFGKLVTGVSQSSDTLKVVTNTFRGTGGYGNIDGFMFALTLIPTVMFALAMITVLDHYGALRAARKLLTPILRPLLGIPGVCGLALITSLQSTDGGAALTRNLKNEGEITETESEIFAMFQLSADAVITNFFSSGAVIFTLTAADGSLAVPTSMGTCLGIMLVMKIVGANFIRFLLVFRGKKNSAA